MKTTLISLVLVFICGMAQAQEVTVTGNGANFQNALQSAKVLATEEVASTFVTGREDLVNGKYKEVLGQYNGGLIQTYKVLSVQVTNGMYAVTIHANVDTDKVNKVIVNGSTATSKAIPHVNKAVDEFYKTVAGWKAIDAASKPFAIAPYQTTYSVYDGRIVDVVYHLTMKWNPKWIDDADKLTQSINRSPLSGEGTYAVCFRANAGSGGICSGTLALPDMKLWEHSDITTVVHFKDGTTETHILVAHPAQSLYSTNDVKLQEPGWFKPVDVVPGVSFMIDTVSLFELRLSFSVAKFAKVENVTFAQ